MKKSEALAHWKSLEENQNPLQHMNAVEYKAKGSKFGACGIRIDGTPDFVDSVLSNLKDLIAGENDSTRLELAYREVNTTEIKGQKKSFDNKSEDAVVCYIRLHERGHQARYYNQRVSDTRKASQSKSKYNEYVVEMVSMRFEGQEIGKSIDVWIEEYPHTPEDSFAVVGKFPNSDEFNISDLISKEDATVFLNDMKWFLTDCLNMTVYDKTDDSLETIIDNLKKITS